MASDGTIPAQLQEQLVHLQQLQQTLQVIISQKQQLELESSEIDRAFGELDKMHENGLVYKSIGSLLLKSEKKKLLEELRERKELITTRITVLSRQQTRTESRLKELQQIIQSKVQPTSNI